MKFHMIAGETTRFHYRGKNFNEAKKVLERSMVFAAMCEAKGNQVQAAKILGMNRNTLRHIYYSLPETYQKIAGPNRVRMRHGR